MKLSLIFVIVQIICASHGHAKIHRLSCKSYADFSITLHGMADTGSKLKTLSPRTKRHCALECISLVTCKSLNYNSNGKSCELIARNLIESIPHITAIPGFIYLSTNDEETDSGMNCKKLSPCVNGGLCTDICEAPGYKCTCDEMHTGTHCENVREFASCKAVYEAGFRQDGVYLLTNMGYHRCVLSTVLPDCGSGGWTLILKTDGSTTTFDYDAAYWTTSNVYNHVYTLQQGLYGEEAKFDAFNKLPFTKICIGMRHGGVNKFLEIPFSGSSMLSVMQSAPYHSTSFGRSKWLGLVSDSQLQPYCNREGINNYVSSAIKVRFGIFGNNEMDCITIDSVIGIGIGGEYNLQTDIKTGVHATYTLNKRIKTHGFILVQ